MSLEGNTHIQIQKSLDDILSALWKYLSTNKNWFPYRSFRAEHHDIYTFILQPDTHPKFTTAKEKHEAFSRALIVHIVKDNTISKSKAPK